MQKSYWFLKLLVQVNGENSFGEHFEVKKDIKILLSATNKEDAKKEALVILKNKILLKSFSKYSDIDVEEDDEIKFKNPRLLYELELKV